MSRIPGSLRLRLTLASVVLVVLVTGGVLLVSWDLMGDHLDRTLPAASADDVADELGRQYLLAVLGAALVTLGLAWAGVGRLLAPVRAIARTAARISDERLDERVDLPGAPGDELHDLGETFDAMLDRVEGAVEGQRRFVANASHELRTPMTVIRTEAEVALDDPDATPQELRAALHAIVEEGERTERLLDGLLVLAGAIRGVGRRAPVDLVAVTARAAAAIGRPDLGEGLEPATVLGDDVLLERLVANLLENAVRHGTDPRVELRVAGPDAFLVVRSSGERIDPDTVARLTEPFERGDRVRRRSGTGLGLSIVRAVAEGHGGALRLHAPADGGLVAEVRLPAAATPAGGTPVSPSPAGAAAPGEQRTAPVG